MYVRIPETDRHYWSPELQIAVEEPEYDEDTLIRCVVGPRPAIWTMFVFFYFLIGVSTFFGGMYGLVQYSLDKESGWVWAFLVGGILISAIYLIAFFGRKKGQEQMVHLIHFASTAIGKENYTRL